MSTLSLPQPAQLECACAGVRDFIFHICVHVHACVFVHMCVFMHACMALHNLVLARVHLRVCLCGCVRTCAYMCA